MVKNIIKSNKKGFITIYIIIALTVLLPFALFISIDLPYMMTMNRKIKNTLDNASATAVTCINEEKASMGYISIIESDAKTIAQKIIAESFGLNSDLSVNKHSLIKEKPKVIIKVINDVTVNPYIDTPNGRFNLKKPSVVIYAEVPVYAKFMYKLNSKIKHTAISQAQFK